MARLSCLTMFEAGAFGSNPGNVLVPTASVQFPVSAEAVGAAAGIATCSSNGGAAVGTSSGTSTATGAS